MGFTTAYCLLPSAYCVEWVVARAGIRTGTKRGGLRRTEFIPFCEMGQGGLRESGGFEAGP